MKDNMFEEAFTSEKPRASHFCVFDCPMSIHIPNEKKCKLEPCSMNDIFVGYSEISKVY
jgi:hypothetical protein